MNITWSVTNLSGIPLQVNMFGYMDPDLMNTPNNDTALLTDFSNTVRWQFRDLRRRHAEQTMDLDGRHHRQGRRHFSAWEIANFDITLREVERWQWPMISQTPDFTWPGRRDCSFPMAE